MKRYFQLLISVIISFGTSLLLLSPTPKLVNLGYFVFIILLFVHSSVFALAIYLVLQDKETVLNEIKDKENISNMVKFLTVSFWASLPFHILNIVILAMSGGFGYILAFWGFVPVICSGMTLSYYKDLRKLEKEKQQKAVEFMKKNFAAGNLPDWQFKPDFDTIKKINTEFSN